jgi:putative nucleotidyltransferase with HDIG domain
MSTETQRKPSPAEPEPPLRIRLLLLSIVVLLFTLILYPNLLVPEIHYDVGDVAERDIKAPKDFLLEDQTATEIKRQQAVNEVPTVYDHDTELAARLVRSVDEALADIRALQKASLDAASPAAVPDAPIAAPPEAKAGPPHSPEDIRKVLEGKLGIRVGRGAYRQLEAEGASKRLADTIGEIVQKVLENGVVANKEVLLRDFENGIVLRDVRTKEEKPVKDFRQFFGLDQARSLVRSAGQPVLKDLDYALANLVVDFSQQLLQPNVTLNRNETEERKKQAAAEIKPVLYKIKAGEMLLREGERVNELHLLKLKALESHARPEQFIRGILGAAALMTALIVVAYVLFLGRSLNRSQTPGRDILFMACMFLLFQLLAQMLVSFVGIVLQNSRYAIPESAAVFIVPLVAAPMIVCVFLKLSAALPFALVTAVGGSLLFDNSLPLSVYYLVVGSMGAYWIQHCRERKIFVTAGVKTGLLGALLAAAFSTYLADFSWSRLLWGAAFAFLGGVGSGIVAAGIVPLVEILFGYTTDISLLELANLDRPILRQLMIEAPGTYHHSVIVGSMVEAAAAEIDANPLLAKVAGYYHDIGKIRKPLYFIENQRNGKNKHDKLAPSMSSLILISHIKEGVEIARENKLNKAIIDIIRQHHGTSLIRYFFEKARQLKGEDAVKEEDFRYPGPTPQSREAALVMLADVVEAASRTLDNPTPARIKGLVQNLFNRILADGQLDRCDMTLKDIHKIAASFNTILNGIHHHRIEYFEQRPAAVEPPKSRPKNGHPHRQPAKAPQDTVEEDKADSAGRLGHLGIS